MKLSVITLTYNNLEYTKKFIKSLYKYTDDFELIIVDNGSTDGTVEYLKTLRENVKLILNPENYGFSRGNNQGIEVAQGEYIGFLNNDILLYPNWFEECEKVFGKEKAAFVSPRQVSPHYDGVNERNYFKSWRKFINYDTDYQKTFDDCFFACVITKREILNQIGYFDENYTPAFFEDNDIKYRAIDMGYDLYVCNKIPFFHFGSVTSEKLNFNYEKNRRYYYEKCRFAEYLSIHADEDTKLKIKIGDFLKFPLNCIYNTYVILKKVCKRIKKIVQK